MRLIDADKVKCEIDWYEPDADRIIRRYIDRQETVDAKPVVHAKWETIISGMKHITICSNCNNTANDDPYFKPIKSKYCPHCGAKMDK